VSNRSPSDTKAALDNLRERFPWVSDWHLQFSDEDLQKHSGFIAFTTKPEWTPSEVCEIGSKSEESLIFDTAKKFFFDDPDVFAHTPLFKNSFRFCSVAAFPKILANTEAHIYFMNEASQRFPVLFKALASPEAVSLLVAGYISE